MHVVPAAAASRTKERATSAPAETSARSTPLSAGRDSSPTSWSSPANRTIRPAERDEASGTNASTGKLRSSRMRVISRPTAPVAPTTATFIGRSSYRASGGAQRNRHERSICARSPAWASNAFAESANWSRHATPSRSNTTVRALIGTGGSQGGVPFQRVHPGHGDRTHLLRVQAVVGLQAANVIGVRRQVTSRLDRLDHERRVGVDPDQLVGRVAPRRPARPTATRAER